MMIVLLVPSVKLPRVTGARTLWRQNEPRHSFFPYAV